MVSVQQKWKRLINDLQTLFVITRHKAMNELSVGAHTQDGPWDVF